MPVTPGPKFNLVKSIVKAIQALAMIILPQLGTMLSTLNPTDGSVLAFITNIFPKLDPTMGMIISSLLLGLLNAIKHWGDGKETK